MYAVPPAATTTAPWALLPASPPQGVSVAWVVCVFSFYLFLKH